LDTTIFKELVVLDIFRNHKSNPLVWRSLTNRFSYLYEHQHDAMKKELADYWNLESEQLEGLHSVLQWEKIQEMKRGEQPRFVCLIKLVQGLLSILFSNAPIEKAFSQLGFIKTNKRLKLKKANLGSFLILKNITRKVRVRGFDTLITKYRKQLKQVKLSLDENNQKNTLKERERLRN